MSYRVLQCLRMLRAAALCCCMALPCAALAAPEIPVPKPVQAMLDNHCLDCHDGETKKGGLDMTALSFDLGNPKAFSKWVTVYDRVKDGEMPPKKKTQPDAAVRTAFLSALGTPLTAADDQRIAQQGRSTWRRMNRYEYENTLRDLLGAPWLQIKEMLPEDGEAFRFNKVGDALDVSHVQMSRYLGAADYALREVAKPESKPPKVITKRYYAREQPAFARKMKFSQFNRSPERATFAILDNAAEVAVLNGEAPMTVGAANPEKRELESMGVVASTYEPLEIKFDQFKARASGRYKIRVKAHSFWAGPESAQKWWRPSREIVSAGRTEEPVTLYAETPPRLLRKLGSFVVKPEATVNELEVYLLKGETIRPDAVRLFRSRPPGGWHNPLAEPDGQPGVAFRWMEVEGPTFDAWPLPGHRLLFGDLPVKEDADGDLEVVSASPHADAEKLLRAFLQRAYRRPPTEDDVQDFLGLIAKALETNVPFADAMIAGYSAVLCSPKFVTLEEKPGLLDDHALATRLSYFLWNSEPDAELRKCAADGLLKKPAHLKAQAKRLIADPRSQRFVTAFLDYWLDLRKIDATSPDAVLYPDYYLDDFLVESSVDETRQFFLELLRGDLPARNIIASDFVTVNARLAAHYGLPPVQGVHMQRVALPKDSPRGGLLTQASVLKVTANGTTTSPVLRGVWIMERILGAHIPPPPTAVPAVEPDTRGATTIREQLEKHRNVESCNVCHAKIDPAGFALESFDILGGFRDKYRALGDGEKPKGYGKNGQPFEFHPAQPVDCGATLPNGRAFADIRELKRLLLADEAQIARNLARQFITFATGAPVGFGDRPELEMILHHAAKKQYGVQSLIYAILESDLFLRK